MKHLLKAQLDVSTQKYVRGREKFYIPFVGPKALLLSWNTKTKALAYGHKASERYKRLLIAKSMAELKEQPSE